MIKAKISLLVIVMLSLITGCNESEQTSDTTRSQIVGQPVTQNPAQDTRTTSEIVEYAKSLQKKAHHSGHAWRTTQDHISEAEKLLALNESDSAEVRQKAQAAIQYLNGRIERDRSNLSSSKCILNILEG